MTDIVREREAVHAARQVNVGEDHVDRRFLLKDLDASSAVAASKTVKPASSNASATIMRIRSSSSTMSTTRSSLPSGMGTPQVVVLVERSATFRYFFSRTDGIDDHQSKTVPTNHPIADPVISVLM